MFIEGGISVWNLCLNPVGNAHNKHVFAGADILKGNPQIFCVGCNIKFQSLSHSRCDRMNGNGSSRLIFHRTGVAYHDVAAKLLGANDASDGQPVHDCHTGYTSYLRYDLFYSKIRGIYGNNDVHFVKAGKGHDCVELRGMFTLKYVSICAVAVDYIGFGKKLCKFKTSFPVAFDYFYIYS